MSRALGHVQRVGGADEFQTPALALEPLLVHIPSGIVWEPACGKGNLVRLLESRGREVVATDKDHDFLSGAVPGFDVIVTNPPFTLKDAFLERCYDLGKPFALLMPITALEGMKRQALYRKNGLELVLMNRRVNFETPSGNGSSAWFATAWFTFGFNMGSQLTFVEIPKHSSR